MKFNPGLITVTLIKKSQHIKAWLVECDGELKSVTTSNRYRKDVTQTVRYAINKALRLDDSDYMFLGNKHVNGQWITEWMRL